MSAFTQLANKQSAVEQENEARKAGGGRAPIQFTSEQIGVARSAHAGRDTKVIALSGTGKTTSLELVSQIKKAPKGRRGLYVAYNAAMRDAAKKTFSDAYVECLTNHGLAWRNTPDMDRFSERLANRLFSNQIVKHFGMRSATAPMVAMEAQALVNQFCMSSATEIDAALARHVPGTIRDAVVLLANKLWDDFSNPNGKLPITHDVYLKRWALRGAPLGNYSYVLYDEAQDGSPVMVNAIAAKDLQKIWVGDPHQQLYAWRGAVNAMRMMGGDEHYLTRSFRFGQDVAELANLVLFAKPEHLRPSRWLVGREGHKTDTSLAGDVGPGWITITRTNAGWFHEARQSEGGIHVIGGIMDTLMLLDAGYKMWKGQKPNHQLLNRFFSWNHLTTHVSETGDRELGFTMRTVEEMRGKLPDIIEDLAARHIEAKDLRPGDFRKLNLYGTGHGVKGLQFANVRLGNDFPCINDDKWAMMSLDEQEAELNVLYVSMTRAVNHLHTNKAVRVIAGEYGDRFQMEVRGASDPAAIAHGREEDPLGLGL